MLIRFILFIFVVSSLVRAQAPSVGEANKMTTAQSARLLANSALDKMGGSNGWEAIHAVEVTGTILRGESKKKIRWVDRWSNDSLEMNRFVSEPEKEEKTFRQNSSNTVTSEIPSHKSNYSNSRIPSSNLKMPRMGIMTALSIYAPAEALVSALSDPSSDFQISQPRSMKFHELCITVSRLIKSQGILENIDFCFDPKTKLPTRAFVPLPSLFKEGTVRSIEEIDYLSFQSQSNLVVPNQVMLKRQNSTMDLYQFDTFSVNPLAHNKR